MNRRGVIASIFAAPFAAKSTAESAVKGMGLPDPYPPTAPGDYIANAVRMGEKASNPISDMLYVAERTKRLNDMLAGEGEEYERWVENVKEGQNDLTYVHYQSLRSVSETGRQHMIRRANFRNYEARSKKSWLRELKELLG